MTRLRGAATGRPAAVAVIVAVAAAPAVLRAKPLAARERAALGAVVRLRRWSWKGPAHTMTRGAEPGVVTAVVAGALAAALSEGARRDAVLRAVSGAAAGVAVRRAMAEVIRRPRPPQSWWWDEPSGYSYPSRHVTWAALGLGAAADLARMGAGRDAIPGLTPAVAAAVGVVASTRVVLAVHWPTDVAAAAVYAAAWRRLVQA